MIKCANFRTSGKGIDETDSRIFHGGSIARTGNWWPGFDGSKRSFGHNFSGLGNRPATRDAFDAHVNG